MREVRSPAVSGLFYKGRPRALEADVRGFLEGASGLRRPAGSWRALLLPHAGHVYSGPVCGAGVGAVEWPETVLLLGPNHTGLGAPVALSPARAWSTPLGEVPISPQLVEALLASCGSIAYDAEAHRQEHALEVILPFLQVSRPDVAIACVTVGAHDLQTCLELGRGVAIALESLARQGREVAIVVSSDLNHFLPREQNWRKDLRALDALESGDAAGLFRRVLHEERISMCGVLPATVLLSALSLLGTARPRVLAHGDSADASGDESRVVGYASVLWERPPTAAPAEV